jgi:hypothetical protein
MSDGDPNSRTSGDGTRGGYGADDPERDSDSGTNPADEDRRADEDDGDDGEDGGASEGSQSTGHPDNAG